MGVRSGTADQGKRELEELLAGFLDAPGEGAGPEVGEVAEPDEDERVRSMPATLAILSPEDGRAVAAARGEVEVRVPLPGKPLLTVNVEMDVKYAIRLLTRFRLTRALVVEHGEMVGIVTLRDMAIRYTAE